MSELCHMKHQPDMRREWTESARSMQSPRWEGRERKAQSFSNSEVGGEAERLVPEALDEAGRRLNWVDISKEACRRNGSSLILSSAAPKAAWGRAVCGSTRRACCKVGKKVRKKVRFEDRVQRVCERKDDQTCFTKEARARKKRSSGF